MKNSAYLLVLLPIISLIAGCGGGSDSAGTGEAGAGPVKVVLQTDWYPQPEHGGFYQALVKGFYAEEGLEVEILPGGPNALIAQKLTQGTAQFGIGRSDEVLLGSERGIPLVMVGALMQKDPQAILFHEESGIETLADLDGRAVMAGPGSAFIEFLKLNYDIDFSVIPLDYGMSRFLADKEFVQQCFITNEPFYVRREGANAKTILLSESGFNPYRVWYTSSSFARQNPEVVAAFHRASIRGWQDYMTGDRTEANAMIAASNPKMDLDFMEYVYEAMTEYKLITGDSGNMEDVGKITPERVQEQIDQLKSINMINSDLSVDDVYFDVEAVMAAKPVTSIPALPVLNWSGEQIAVISEDTIGHLPLQPAKVEIETAGVPLPVRGVLLKDALAALELSLDWDLVLADCSDGYQSNYTNEVMAANEPLLILEIDGQPTHLWCESKGHPEWGPYMVQILKTDDLLDPVNKNPWGVESIRVGSLDGMLAKLSAGSGDWETARNGFEIFKGNCASCHALETAGIGGNLSTRNGRILAALAKNAEDYFLRILEDPVGTNPTAAKMPAVPHYGDEEKRALIAFLTNYK